MKIALCIPTRGTVFTECLQSSKKNLEKAGVEWECFFTYDLPIPDAQNKLVQDALYWGADYIWFVEEDMLVPEGILSKMVAEDKDVVAVDYPVGNRMESTMAIKDEEVVWCGLGCTLIKKEVLEKVGKGAKWFRTDKQVIITDKKKLEYELRDTPYKYGGHDILFGLALREAGIEIYRMPGVTAGHMHIAKLGARESNVGMHKIVVRDKIKEYKYFN